MTQGGKAMQSDRQSEIDHFITRYVSKQSQGVSSALAQEFGISRQAAHRHVQRLVQEGILEASGSTKARTYKIQPYGLRRREFQLEESLREDEVWRNHVVDLLEGIPNNVLEICSYGFTEMFNNAIDHSEGTVIEMFISVDAVEIRMDVQDNGVGVFRKIREHYALSDDRDALFELSKGKVTTDPENHTGEGIYFASRMFDSYSLFAGRLIYSHAADGDVLVDTVDRSIPGTTVRMKIAADSGRTVQEVYGQSSMGEDNLGFSRTTLFFQLMRQGNENLVSRSQARRALAGTDRFREIVLNFEGVDSIGQAFADEVFRVFRNAHPDIELIPTNLSNQVQKMIDRVQAG